MRKADREIKDFDEKIKLIDKCDVLRVGFNDNEVPYVLPLSFGYEVDGDKVIFYTHGAKEGKKHDLAAKGGKVFVELDVFNGYVDLGSSMTADFESIMGVGEIEIVKTNEERIHGLELVLKHAGAPMKFSAKVCIALNITEVLKITVSNFTGKRRFNKN